MKTIAIVQARMGSTRFPGKVLADLCGKPVIAHVIERAKAIRSTDGVVLACPAGDRAAFANLGLGVPIVAHTENGDENDVLSRFVETVRRYPADLIIRITADCPCLAPDLAEDTARWLAMDPAGPPYACTRHDGGLSGWPDGLDVEALTIKALLEAGHEATGEDREHVTRWIHRKHGESYITSRNQWPVNTKLSIDCEADLEYARRVMTRIDRQGDWIYVTSGTACITPDEDPLNRRGRFGWLRTWFAVIREAREWPME